jgi:hypothetical protein
MPGSAPESLQGIPAWRVLAYNHRLVYAFLATFAVMLIYHERVARGRRRLTWSKRL